MVELASPHPQWEDHHQLSVILTGPSPVVTLAPQLRGLDHERVVLLVCTAHSSCPWPLTATARLAAPISTMRSAPGPLDHSRRSLPCPPTTKDLHTPQCLEAKPTRLMVFLHGLRQAPAVAMAEPARFHSIPTIRWRGLICAAPNIPVHAPSRQSRAQAELPCHRLRPERHFQLTYSRPPNSRSRFTHLRLPRFLLLWSP
jgi:hypothetical protein